MLKAKSVKKSTLVPDSKDILPLCFVGLTIFSGLTFFFLLFLSVRVNQLAAKKTTFVQLVDGQALVAREQDELYRQPEVIKNTVRQWLSLTFDWSGVIPGTNEPDRGHVVSNNKRVTTNAYFGSFLIQAGAKGFRSQALEAIAELTPSQVFSGKIRSKLVISYLSAPRQTRLGEWQVDVISTRVLVNLSGGRDDEISFNRTITLRAVDIPAPLLQNASALEQRLYQIRSAGLEITKISNFTPNK